MKSWLVHIVLAGIMAAQFGLWLAQHRSDEEINAAWAGGTTDERIEALFIQANRGEPNPALFDESFVEAMLLNETDERLKEFVFTNDIAKFAPPPTLQGDYIFRGLGGGLPAHRLRSWLILFRRVGSLRLHRVEVGWFLDAMAGRPLSKEDVSAHMEQRMSEITKRRELKEESPNESE